IRNGIDSSAGASRGNCNSRLQHRGEVDRRMQNSDAPAPPSGILAPKLSFAGCTVRGVSGYPGNTPHRTRSGVCWRSGADMRAWVIAGILLVAGTAAADDAGDTEVPPLAYGESAPEDAPNYFDAHELGAATLATFAACQDTIARAY